MARSRNSLNDAMAKYFGSKFPFNDVPWQNQFQTLFSSTVNSGVDTAAVGVVSADMGRPDWITVFIQGPTNSTDTVNISLSNDGVTWFTVTYQAALVQGGYVVKVPGASFIKINSNVTMATTYTIQVLANY